MTALTTTSIAGHQPAQIAQLDPAQVAARLDAGTRRGYCTTEFWLTVATWILPIVTLKFHENLSSLAVPLATLAAGIANATYTISRAVTKNGHANAVASATGAAAAQQPVDPTGITTWVTNMAGAVETLTNALATATTAGQPNSSTANQTVDPPAR